MPIVLRKTRLKPRVCHVWRDTATGQVAVLPRIRAPGTCESAVAQRKAARRAGAEMQSLELWAAEDHSWTCVRTYSDKSAKDQLRQCFARSLSSRCASLYHRSHGAPTGGHTVNCIGLSVQSHARLANHCAVQSFRDARDKFGGACVHTCMRITHPRGLAQI